MEKKLSQLKSGVILSYINLVLGCIIPMIYTPIMLRLLGKSEYGLYSIANSVISYLSVLNFGLGSTIIRYISKYRALNQKEEEEKVFGLFLKIYGILTALVLIGGIILAAMSGELFSEGLSGTECAKLKVLIIILTINTAISFPESVFISVITGHERYIFSKSIDIFSTVAVPISNLIVLFLGAGSIGMATISALVRVVTVPAYIIYCFRNLGIKPRFKKTPRDLLKEILGFSVFVFIGSIVDVLFWATDKVILGARVGSEVVAVYNIGATFNSMISSVSTSMSGVLTPRITGMVVSDTQNSRLNDLFIKIGRLQFLLIGLIVSGFIVFGKPFVSLWAGEDYWQSYYIALLTMIPLCIPLVQSSGKSIVIAQNKHAFRSIVYLIIAIINVISTYLVAPYWGGIGAALCTCVSYIVGQGIIMNWYYYKITKLDIPSFWKNIMKMAIVPIGLIVVFFFIEQQIDFYRIDTFLIGVAVYTVVYSALMFKFEMNNSEKSLILDPMRGIIKKLPRRK